MVEKITEEGRIMGSIARSASIVKGANTTPFNLPRSHMKFGTTLGKLCIVMFLKFPFQDIGSKTKPYCNRCNTCLSVYMALFVFLAIFKKYWPGHTSAMEFY